jgi:tetratricopeptide (TPR) repeat protein
MHSFKFKFIALVALTPFATACSSIFGTSASAGLPEVRLAAADSHSAVQATIALEEGRAHLAAGNPGLAIESFQRVLGSGELVGPAANGIGVAYARIGRADLARRYFNQAIATAPAEPAYLANLERLESSPGMAVATQVTVRPSVAAAVEERTVATPTNSTPRGVRLEPRNQVVRVSRSEVRIATAPTAGGRSTVSVEELERNFQPIVRISLARETRAASTRPSNQVVRITLPEATPVRQ